VTTILPRPYPERMPPPVLMPAPEAGRVFRHPATVGLGDVSPAGRARLDAIARWLQDAAYADWVDAGLDDGGVWIVRRLHLRVERFPRFGEALAVDTFCSGTGRLWAERRSTLRGDDGALVEAVAVWVHLDARGVRPRPLPAGFEAVYGAAAAGRRVGARLSHPAEPPAGALARAWNFRAADLDLADHVNNAVYWQAIEEELVTDEPAGGLVAEIEHRAAADAGPATLLRAGPMRWLVREDGEVLATLALGDGAA
jgi:acyl-ACP thioesterase